MIARESESSYRETKRDETRRFSRARNSSACWNCGVPPPRRMHYVILSLTITDALYPSYLTVWFAWSSCTRHGRSYRSAWKSTNRHLGNKRNNV